MNKIILGLMFVTLLLGSVSFYDQMKNGVKSGQTCAFGKPCCKKESDIDWSYYKNTPDN